MKAVGECLVVHYGARPDIKGYSMVQLIETSLISGHFVEATNNVFIDVFSCQHVDVGPVASFCREFFGATEVRHSLVIREDWPEASLQNEMVATRETNDHGIGLFAKRDIAAGALVAEFDGPIYHARQASDLPNDSPLMVRDRAIQISEHTWQDSVSPARFANHSCNPNCGVDGCTKLVAMRPIAKGEEVTFDYDMTEDSDWEMSCRCGEPECRSAVRGFRFLPRKKVDAYGPFVSDWLAARTARQDNE